MTRDAENTSVQQETAASNPWRTFRWNDGAVVVDQWPDGTVSVKINGVEVYFAKP